MKTCRVLVNAENGQTTANLIRNEFLLNRAAYALDRPARVQNIVDNALFAFKSAVTPEPNSPIPLDSNKKKKSINVKVEGRITFV